jgi:hypothetical protein
MTFLEHQGWARVLCESCVLFTLGVTLLTLSGRTRKRNRRTGLPKPSEKCKRPGPESLP